MQHVHVKRYTEPNAYAGTIEPEDRSWVLFVAKDGPPSLWVATDAIGNDGQTVHVYAPADAVA